MIRQSFEPEVSGGLDGMKPERRISHEGRVDLPAPVPDFMEQVVTRFGALHIVCSLVGGWAGGRDVEETSDVRFDRMIDVNLRSAFATVRAAIPHLKKAGWGRILLVGSRAAAESPAGQAAFNAAKAGVLNLTQAAASCSSKNS